MKNSRIRIKIPLLLCVLLCVAACELFEEEYEMTEEEKHIQEEEKRWGKFANLQEEKALTPETDSTGVVWGYYKEAIYKWKLFGKSKWTIEPLITNSNFWNWQFEFDSVGSWLWGTRMGHYNVLTLLPLSTSDVTLVNAACPKGWRVSSHQDYLDLFAHVLGANLKIIDTTRRFSNGSFLRSDLKGAIIVSNENMMQFADGAYLEKRFWVRDESLGSPVYIEFTTREDDGRTYVSWVRPSNRELCQVYCIQE